MIIIYQNVKEKFKKPKGNTKITPTKEPSLSVNTAINIKHSHTLTQHQ